jgi:hypothetical protein
VPCPDAPNDPAAAAAAPGTQPSLTEAALLAWPAAGAAVCEPADPFVVLELDVPVLLFAPAAADWLVLLPGAPVAAIPTVAPVFVPALPAAALVPVLVAVLAPLPGATPPEVLGELLVAAVPGWDVVVVLAAPGLAVGPLADGALPVALVAVEPGAAAPVVPLGPPAAAPAAPPAPPPPAPPPPAAKPAALISTKTDALKSPTKARDGVEGLAGMGRTEAATRGNDIIAKEVPPALGCLILRGLDVLAAG